MRTHIDCLTPLSRHKISKVMRLEKHRSKYKANDNEDGNYFFSGCFVKCYLF